MCQNANLDRSKVQFDTLRGLEREKDYPLHLLPSQHSIFNSRWYSPFVFCPPQTIIYVSEKVNNGVLQHQANFIASMSPSKQQARPTEEQPLKACIPFSEYNKSASDKMPLQRRQRCPFR
jgi:hypothetical protein